ncbi:MAG TPA: hypothetical protein VLQ68_00330 [Rhizobiaceae bacterium]|nr:hypothetical protein [Rhizobiaceae bacterium]
MKSILMSAAAAAVLLASQGAALADDPLVGTWVRQGGPLISVEPCGPRFCVSIASGDAKGEEAGTIQMNGDGTYSTLVENVENGNPVSGTGALVDNVFTITLAQGNTEETWQRH